jgi:sugar phosphate isomerase/epimerase
VPIVKRCLFSVGYAGSWGQARLDLEAFAERAARLGYESVMLMGKRPHLSPLDYDAARARDLRATLRGHGLTCDVIAAYTDFAPAPAAEVPAIEMQVGWVEALARLGAELGASVVRVFTAYEPEGRAPHESWRTVAGALREAAARVADRGLVLAVQNHHDTAVDSDALLDLLTEVDHPACRLGFDAWSPALRGEDLYGTALRMAPHAAITTNADYVRVPRWRYEPAAVNYRRIEPDLVRAVPFGDGFVDYEAFFRGLRDGGFDGIATYEMCSPIRGGGALENLDRYAARYVEWCRAHGIGGA